MVISRFFPPFAPAEMSCIISPDVKDPLNPDPVILEKRGPFTPGVLCHSVIELVKLLADVFAKVETVVKVNV